MYEGFARLYEGFYGYRLDGIPIELVRLQVVLAGEAFGLDGRPAGAPEAAGDEGPSRQVWFPGHGFVAAPSTAARPLRPARWSAAPLVVEEMDSTIVVPPEWQLAVADADILELVREDIDVDRPPTRSRSRFSTTPS